MSYTIDDIYTEVMRVSGLVGGKIGDLDNWIGATANLEELLDNALGADFDTRLAESLERYGFVLPRIDGEGDDSTYWRADSETGVEEEVQPVDLYEDVQEDSETEATEEAQKATSQKATIESIVQQTEQQLAIIRELSSQMADMTKEVGSNSQSVNKLNFKETLPLSSDEWLAQKVYKAAGNLQLIEARQMLQLYGRELVGKVLGRMEYLKQRGNIQNPAGFLKDALRVAWRAKHGFAEIPPKYISPKRS